jgi:hypothetical protein
MGRKFQVENAEKYVRNLIRNSEGKRLLAKSRCMYLTSKSVFKMKWKVADRTNMVQGRDLLRTFVKNIISLFSKNRWVFFGN